MRVMRSLSLTLEADIEIAAVYCRYSMQALQPDNIACAARRIGGARVAADGGGEAWPKSREAF